MRTLALVATLLGVAASGAGAQRVGSHTSSRMDTTLAFPRDGNVEVSIPAGDVTITGWDRDAARVVATSDAGVVELEWSGTRLELAQRAARRHAGATRIEMSVPRGARVSITTFAGDLVVRDVGGLVTADASTGSIEVSDLSSGANLTTTTGDIRGRGLGGRITAVATSGNIELSEVRGEVDVATTAGAVRLLGVRSTAVKAGAINGNVEFAGTLEAGGRYAFNAHNGNVVMEIPESTSAAFSLRTFNGHFQTDIPLTLGPGGLRRGAPVSFTLGAGEATVTAITHSGNIIIRRPQRQNR